MSAEFNQFRGVPLVVPTLRGRASEIGLADTVAEMLDEANVTIDVRGDTSKWAEAGQPVLAVGDHSKGMESVLILGAMSKVGRRDVSVTAKPYAFTGQFINGLTEPDDNHLIGFTPSAMAKERKGGDLGIKLHKLVFRRQLMSQQQISESNVASIAMAGSLLEEEGRVVTIFPTGGVYPAATTPWRDGVGHVAAELSPEAFERTIVVPFWFDKLEPISIFSAVLASRMSLKPLPKQASIVFGGQSTLGELFPDGKPSPREITEKLRQEFERASAADDDSASDGLG